MWCNWMKCVEYLDSSDTLTLSKDTVWLLVECTACKTGYVLFRARLHYFYRYTNVCCVELCGWHFHCCLNRQTWKLIMGEMRRYYPPKEAYTNRAMLQTLATKEMCVCVQSSCIMYGPILQLRMKWMLTLSKFWKIQRCQSECISG